MVRANGLALWLLTAASVSTTTLQARRTERSILGKKISPEDVVRVQDARLERLHKRIEKMRCAGCMYCLYRRGGVCTRACVYRREAAVLVKVCCLHSRHEACCKHDRDVSLKSAIDCGTPTLQQQRPVARGTQQAICDVVV